MGDARRALPEPGPRHALGVVKWLEPVPRAPDLLRWRQPPQGTRARRAGVRARVIPPTLQKPAETSVPHGGALSAPTASEQLGHQGEFVAVVGPSGAHPGREGAGPRRRVHLHGRRVRAGLPEAQRLGRPELRAAGGIGPLPATTDEVGGSARLTPMTRLHGAVAPPDVLQREAHPRPPLGHHAAAARQRRRQEVEARSGNLHAG